MVVYEKIFLEFSQNFLSKAKLKKNSHSQPLENFFRISQNGVLFPHRAQCGIEPQSLAIQASIITARPPRHLITVTLAGSLISQMPLVLGGIE